MQNLLHFDAPLRLLSQAVQGPVLTPYVSQFRKCMQGQTNHLDLSAEHRGNSSKALERSVLILNEKGSENIYRLTKNGKIFFPE